MDIIEKVRQFVKNECQKPSSKYGVEPYEFHFVPTVKYAKQLADKYGADMELIEIAAWLHDIGSIIYGRKDHHATGAQVAGEKLREFGYDKEKIEKVRKCILHHRGSQKLQLESLEEQILAEADAMSNFDEIAGIFKAAYVYENMTQGEARIAVLQKLENKWKQLRFKKSKEIIKPKYEAIRLLLK